MRQIFERFGRLFGGTAREQVLVCIILGLIIILTANLYLDQGRCYSWAGRQLFH